MQKIYCHIDESGQDTKGKIFVVASIISTQSNVLLEEELNKLEKISGRNNQKWHKSSYIERINYIRSLNKIISVKNFAYVKIYYRRKDYIQMTGEAAAESIICFAKQHSIKNFRGIITIDGTNEVESRIISKAAREKGIFIEKVRGARDENNIVIRLADSLAGLTRDALSGEVEFGRLLNKLLKKKIIINL